MGNLLFISGILKRDVAPEASRIYHDPTNGMA